MQRPWLTLLALVTALALALAASGCGGGDGNGARAPETAPGPGGETVTAPVETGGEPPDTVTEAGETFCSATGAEAGPPAQELPEPVVATRQQLWEAAAACDYAALEEIASRSEGFTYTFGQPGESPAAFWRDLEENATGEPMYVLVTLFTLPFARNESGSYVWPSAHSPDATDADWQLLVDEAFYTQQEIQQMRAAGTGYTGWRTAITPEGEWQYLVEGD